MQHSQPPHEVPGHQLTALMSFKVALESKPLNPWKLMSFSASLSVAADGFLSSGFLGSPLALQNWSTTCWTPLGRQSAQLHNYMLSTGSPSTINSSTHFALVHSTVAQSCDPDRLDRFVDAWQLLCDRDGTTPARPQFRIGAILVDGVHERGTNYVASVLGEDGATSTSFCDSKSGRESNDSRLNIAPFSM